MCRRPKERKSLLFLFFFFVNDLVENMNILEFSGNWPQVGLKRGC